MEKNQSPERTEEYSSVIFDVLITETRSKIVRIEAQTEEEAIAQVEEKYLKGEIALNNDENFEDANYMVIS